MSTAPEPATIETHASWPVFHGQLGVELSHDSTVFTVWAPTASHITVRLFHSGDGSKQTFRQLPLSPLHDGAWRLTLPSSLAGIYYDYLVEFPDGTCNRTCDPWGKASGVNGERSMVVDLADTDPAGWCSDRSPQCDASQTVIWETHIRDFSNDPHAGFPQAHRGKYLAFTDEHTTLDNQQGPHAFPTGLDYLHRLGVTHIELLPFYDYGSVDERDPNAYNWGYDPVAFNVPEGSYSTNPYDGVIRIRECKAMIESLHRHGFLVIMDVVYNHMFVSDNPFERFVPGYFCRRNADGTFTNGSLCGNDMDTQRPMVEHFIIDSLLYWAQEYHVDGFRFDLMGLLGVDMMNHARQALNKIPGGSSLLMFGEPWAADNTQLDPSLTLAGGKNTRLLDSSIGWFCDRTRDVVKGNVMHQTATGFVNGAISPSSQYRKHSSRPDAHTDASNRVRTYHNDQSRTEESARQSAHPSAAITRSIIHAVDAWKGTVSQPKQPLQLIQYVSSHDDLTLWDKLCRSMRVNPTDTDYSAARATTTDILTANVLAAGLILTAAGTPFMLAGEEFARTKLGCDDSFNKSAQLNQLDWRRAQQLQPLTDWYRALIEIRHSHPQLSSARHQPLSCSSNAAAYRVARAGLIICANPTDTPAVIILPAKTMTDDWAVLLSSRQFTGLKTIPEKTYRHSHGYMQGVHDQGKQVLVAPSSSFIIWQARR